MSNSDLATIFGWQLASLVILSLVAHVTVLFGGGPACEAKAFLIDKTMQSWLRQKCRREEASVEQRTRAAARVFEEYLRMLNEHSQRYPSTPMTAGPFSAEERNFFNKYYGYDIIPHPNGNGTGPNREPKPNITLDPPPPPPVDPLHPAGPTNGKNEETNGETDYLRTILERHIQDNESEVRP